MNCGRADRGGGRARLGWLTLGLLLASLAAPAGAEVANNRRPTPPPSPFDQFIQTIAPIGANALQNAQPQAANTQGAAKTNQTPPAYPPANDQAQTPPAQPQPQPAVFTPPQQQIGVVPQLRGLSPAQASDALIAAGFSEGQIGAGSHDAHATVVRQRPAAHAQAVIGSVVYVLTRAGGAPPPPPRLSRVPSLAGQTPQQARDTLAVAGLQLGRRMGEGAEPTAGRISYTYPPTGDRVPSDSVVDYALQPPIPWLGLTAAGAIAALAGVGLARRLGEQRRRRIYVRTARWTVQTAPPAVALRGGSPGSGAQVVLACAVGEVSAHLVSRARTPAAMQLRP